MSLFALSSKVVKPIIKKKKNVNMKKKPWNENYINSRTITIKQGRIAHEITSNILPDAKYSGDQKTSGYMEDFFLDEKSQLEKRIAIGDSSYLEHLKDEDKVIMKKVIKDIQSQLLTHNGFVKTIRTYRKEIDDEVSTQLTQFEQEFDEEHNLRRSDDDDNDDDSDEDIDESNPLSGDGVDEEQRKYFREVMKKKSLFLKEKREIIRNELIEDISLEIRRPFKDPSTIQERTFNDPRNGVVCNFVPSDQPNRPRASVYKCVHKKDDYYLQTLDERNAEYDLMAYPLFFPEGSDLKMGWTDNIPKVMNKKQLVNSLYKRVKKKLDKSERTKNRKMSDRVKVIAKYLEVPDLHRSDYDYEQLIDPTHPHISCKQWYNFMLYERAGFIKEKHFTPEMEKHEYYTCCNMKLSARKKTQDRMVELKDDEVLYNQSSTEGTTEFVVKVHPKSRCPYIVVDGVEHPIDVNNDEDRDKDLSTIRHPEKKNPILYLNQ